MSEAPAIMFVKPGAINAEDKAALRDARVLVVETDDPSAIRLVQAGHDLPTSELLAAAGWAIRHSNAARKAFGEALAKALGKFKELP